METLIAWRISLNIFNDENHFLRYFLIRFHGSFLLFLSLSQLRSIGFAEDPHAHHHSLESWSSTGHITIVVCVGVMVSTLCTCDKEERRMRYKMFADLSSPKWWTSSSNSRSIAPKRNMCRRHDRVRESHFSGWLSEIHGLAQSAEVNCKKVLHKLYRLTVVTIILAFATSWRLRDISTSPVTSMTL